MKLCNGFANDFEVTLIIIMYCIFIIYLYSNC